MRRTVLRWCPVVIFAVVQIVLRLQSAPPIKEAVPWEAFERLGSPPYAAPVLLSFSANWCEPCVRMRLTVFSDPSLAERLGALGLRTVRIEETDRNHEEFRQQMQRFRVEGLPALVMITREGRHFVVGTGRLSKDQVEHLVGRAFVRAERGLYWSRPQSTRLDEGSKPVIRSFDTWHFVPRLRSEDRDWRWSTDLEFVRWGNDHFVFVEDELATRSEGFQYYDSFHIRTVPTVVVAVPGRGEVARFEGAAEVARVPQLLPSILRGVGVTIPDPPNPGGVDTATGDVGR